MARILRAKMRKFPSTKRKNKPPMPDRGWPRRGSRPTRTLVRATDVSGPARRPHRCGGQTLTPTPQNAAWKRCQRTVNRRPAIGGACEGRLSLRLCKRRGAINESSAAHTADSHRTITTPDRSDVGCAHRAISSPATSAHRVWTSASRVTGASRDRSAGKTSASCRGKRVKPSSPRAGRDAPWYRAPGTAPLRPQS